MDGHQKPRSKRSKKKDGVNLSEEKGGSPEFARKGGKKK